MAGSGRRGGGECERRGPSVSRRVFAPAVLLLVVVLVCRGTCEAAPAGKSGAGRRIVFAGVEQIPDTEDATRVASFDSFRAPSLVAVRGVVVAVAEAHFRNTSENKSYVGIAAKSLKANAETWTDGTAIAVDHYDVEVYRLLNPTTAVEGTEVWALLGCYGESGAPLTEVPGGGHWTARMATGWVPKDRRNNRRFEWKGKSTSEIPTVLFGKTASTSNPYQQFLGGGGAGVRLGDDSYALPIQALKNDGTKLSLLILASDSARDWRFSEGTSNGGCIQPAVLQWKDGDLLVMTSCGDGSRRVYEVRPDGKLWVEAYDSISRVWGNSATRKGHGVQGGFVRATIHTKAVILVTQPVYSGANGEETGRLHLWLTDMDRIHDAGPVSADGENVAASTLLYTTSKAPVPKQEEEDDDDDDDDDGESDDEEGGLVGKLYCSYEVAVDGGKYKIAFADLTDKLEDLKKVVDTWKKNDAQVAKEYGCAGEDKMTRHECKSGVAPAKGLVGLLSSTSDKDRWKDEYLGVDATLHGSVTSAEKGVTFKGSGSWAEWPVGKRGQNVPYYFANNAFTLVVAVTIHVAPSSGSIPLMGVRMDDTGSTAIFGLSYTHDKKWRFALHNKSGGRGDGDNGEWKTNTAHQVVVQMKFTEWYVYVDGVEVYDEEYEGDLFNEHRISHFYFGAGSEDGAESSHVTVGGVRLYNRLLTQAELTAPQRDTSAEAMEQKAVGTPDQKAEKAPKQKDVGTPQEKDEKALEQKSASTPEHKVAETLENKGVEAPRHKYVEKPGQKAEKAPEKEDEKAMEPKGASETSTEGKTSPKTAETSVATNGTQRDGSPPPRDPPALPPKDENEGNLSGKRGEEKYEPPHPTVRQAQQSGSPHASENAGKVEPPSDTHTSNPEPPSEEEVAPAQPSGGELDRVGAPPPPRNNSHGPRNTTEPSPMGPVGEGTVRGCLSRASLPLLLGLWGFAALW